MHLKAVYQKLNRQYSFGLHLVNISIISKRIKLLYWIKKKTDYKIKVKKIKKNRSKEFLETVYLNLISVKMYKNYSNVLILLSILTSALCAILPVKTVDLSSNVNAQPAIATKESETSSLGSEFSVLLKVYDDCQETKDFTGCLKHKALTAITRAMDMVRHKFFFR
jgi:hypothetical protein